MTNKYSPSQRIVGISRAVAVVIIVVIIIAVGATGAYLATLGGHTGTSASTSPTSSASSSSSTSSSSVSAFRQQLTIDDLFWPAGDLNQLTALGEIPYPNWLTYTVYQSLVTVNGSLLYGQGTVEVLPMLATSWTVSSDGRTYSFNLRPGVTFSDGNPLNSYQVWG